MNRSRLQVIRSILKIYAGWLFREKFLIGVGMISIIGYSQKLLIRIFRFDGDSASRWSLSMERGDMNL